MEIMSPSGLCRSGRAWTWINFYTDDIISLYECNVNQLQF